MAPSRALLEGLQDFDVAAVRQEGLGHLGRRVFGRADQSARTGRRAAANTHNPKVRQDEAQRLNRVSLALTEIQQLLLRLG